MSLEVVEEERIQREILDAPMLISDVVARFKHKYHMNEGVVTSRLMRLNDALVEEWAEKVLKPRGDDRGYIKSSAIDALWMIFYEGRAVRKAYPLLQDERNINPAPSAVEWWLEFFKQDLDKIHEAGAHMVTIGYTTILAAYRNWDIHQKYTRVFFSEDINEWYEAAQHNKMLLNGSEKPFEYEEAIAKARYTLAVKVTPSSR